MGTWIATDVGDDLQEARAGAHKARCRARDAARQTASLSQSGREDPTVPVRGFGAEDITRPSAALRLWS